MQIEKLFAPYGKINTDLKLCRFGLCCFFIVCYAYYLGFYYWGIPSFLIDLAVCDEIGSYVWMRKSIDCHISALIRYIQLAKCVCLLSKSFDFMRVCGSVVMNTRTIENR